MDEDKKDDYSFSEKELRRMYSRLYETVNSYSPERLKGFPITEEAKFEDLDRLSIIHSSIIREEWDKNIQKIRKSKRSTGIALVVGFLLTIAGGSLTVYNLNPSLHSPQEQCDTHTLQPNETLDDAVLYFKTINPDATEDEIVNDIKTRNKLLIYHRSQIGQDITYCFEK